MSEAPSPTDGSPGDPRVISILITGGLLQLTMLWWCDWPLFVWGDVALVYFVGALPAALVLSAYLSGRLHTALDWAIGAGLVAAPFFLIELVPHGGTAMRWVAALSLSTGLLLCMLAITRKSASSMPQSLAPQWLLPALLILLLPTSIYGGVRFQSERKRLGEYVDNSRLGEARIVAARLLKWDPEAVWRGRPLFTVERELDRLVEALTQEVGAPLAGAAPFEDRVERGRKLAILGRTDEALAILATIPAGSCPPAACNLIATIHEARGEWSDASHWYQRALDVSDPTNVSRNPADEAEILRAWQGVGFNERRMGHLASAEFAYNELLKRAPDAQRHFLLGQFYEDTQQTALAREHLRRAIELDPGRYRDEGERLLQKLAIGHFGCLRIYRDGDSLSHIK
jgi:tetratricopeptide (TPR) repeat protein